MPSPDSTPKENLKQSSFLKKHFKRRTKKVHWDPSTVDNEQKNVSRSKVPDSVPNKKTATAAKILASQPRSEPPKPTMEEQRGAQVSSPGPSLTNRDSGSQRYYSPPPPAKNAEGPKTQNVTESRPPIIPKNIGQDKQGPSRERPGPLRTPASPTQLPVNGPQPQKVYAPKKVDTKDEHPAHPQRSPTPANTVKGPSNLRTPAQPGPTPKQAPAHQCPRQRPQSTSGSDLIVIAKPQRNIPPANTGVKRDPKATAAPQPAMPSPRQQPVPTARVPPAAPEPPRRRLQKPPPAPRPARLPTPDLPDIGGSHFCNCGPPCDDVIRAVVQSDGGKMSAQIQAAKAYMKASKQRK